MEKVLTFDNGEKTFNIEITDHVNGFLISYYSLLFNDIPLKEIKNLSSILERIKRVANELEVFPSEFIIEFQYDCGTAFCAVDNKKVLLLSLPIFVVSKKIVINNQDRDEDYLLYHELMHAKEVLDGRFPPNGRFGPGDYTENIIGRLNDFANEGRLEKMGKPHEPKDVAIEDVYTCLQEDCFEWGIIPLEKANLLTKELVKKLCEQVWGKKITRAEAEQIVKEALDLK